MGGVGEAGRGARAGMRGTQDTWDWDGGLGPGEEEG